MLIIIAIITVVFLLLALSSNIALVLLFREMSKLGRLELVPPILHRVVINNNEDDIENDIINNNDIDCTPRVPPPTPLLEVMDLPFEFMHAYKPLPHRMIDIYYFYDMAEHWTATYWSMYDVLNDSEDDYMLLTPLMDGLDLVTVVPMSYDLDE